MTDNARIFPFKYAHLDYIDIRDYEKNTIFSVPGMREKFKGAEGAMFAGTIMYKDILLGCVGCKILWPGVGELWSVPSNQITTYGKIYARMIKKQISSIIRFYDFHRLQVTTPADDMHSRFWTWMGFTRECTLKHFGCGKEDYNLYARVI